MRRKRFISLGLVAVSILAATCFAAASARGGGQTVVKVLMIGYPDKDTTDASHRRPGARHRPAQGGVRRRNPTIDLEIINIPWGSGATGYAPKTEAMIKANEACLYEMPGAAELRPRGPARQPRTH